MDMIYPALVEDLLAPLTGLADCDEKVFKYRRLHGNNRLAVMDVIREQLLPYYQSAIPAKQAAAKLAIRYYLTKPNTNFERVYDSLLLPFEDPDDARDFFVWTWQVLFGDEDFTLPHWEEYPVDSRVDWYNVPEFSRNRQK